MCRPERWTDSRGLPDERVAKRGAHAAAAAVEEGEFRHGYFFLPSLRKIYSPRYLMPLPLYGSGLRQRRISAATWPTFWLSMPLISTVFWSGVLTSMPSGIGEIDVVAVAELEAQVLALGLGAIADAGDFEHLGEAFGHAGDEVLDQRPLHAPRGAIALRVDQRRDADFALGDLIFHEVVEQLHRRAGPWAP